MTASKTALDPKLFKKIEIICEKGEEQLETEEYHSAIDTFMQAYDLVPDPKIHWNVSTWILTALGDAHFMLGDFAALEEATGFAMLCPEGAVNPYLHLRLGQAHFELGNMGPAKEQLDKAFAAEGEDIFGDDDPKYLALAQSN
ncbi:MAG: tetratricopeptide (TPR) repeat protein [Moritella sp.]|jgi:tetratricopeptide (TPR) repeat protein